MPPYSQLCSHSTAGLSLYGAIADTNTKPGDWLALPGAGGGLGHLGLQIALRKGLKVIAIDSGADKKAVCEELGATAFIDFKDGDVSRPYLYVALSRLISIDLG